MLFDLPPVIEITVLPSGVPSLPPIEIPKILPTDLPRLLPSNKPPEIIVKPGPTRTVTVSPQPKAPVQQPTRIVESPLPVETKVVSSPTVIVSPSPSPVVEQPSNNSEVTNPTRNKVGPVPVPRRNEILGFTIGIIVAMFAFYVFGYKDGERSFLKRLRRQ